MVKIYTPELLAPAGDPKRLEYAIAYGADAVYAGQRLFASRKGKRLSHARRLGKGNPGLPKGGKSFT